MKHLVRTVRALEDRRVRILDELHPLLRERVAAVLTDTGGRLAPWCGFRGQVEQDRAFAEGNSNARFGESPHNFAPALACDLVLSPALVRVRPHPDDPSVPDLWDDESPEALAAWEALEQAAKAHGLARVNVRGRRDRPHVELPSWRSYVPT